MRRESRLAAAAPTSPTSASKPMTVAVCLEDPRLHNLLRVHLTKELSIENLSQ